MKRHTPISIHIAGQALLSLILMTAHAAESAVGPWGVASSASSFRNHVEWFPKLSAAGLTSVRLFPEWRSLEPTPGAWQWEKLDAMLQSAASHKLQINAVLMGSAPASKKLHAFPMKELDAWSHFVSTVVGRYKNRIRYWEVWNEGNGGFNDEQHTTVDYAKLAAATYAAAKKAAPQAQVGLSVASFDAPYLEQAIRAMALAEQANSFDFLCIHPYELAENIGEPDGEIPFLGMGRLLREMLKTCAPERADAELWMTEVGRRIEKRNGRVVSEEDAAKALVKIYVMALAQGFRRTQWFEGQDPAGEEAGFGLITREGHARKTYHCLKTMAACLGAKPRYEGWLALSGGDGFGFVFTGADGPVLAAWMPPGGTEKNLTFAGDVEVVDSFGGGGYALKAGQALALTDVPVFIAKLPAELLAQALANADKPFPWGGAFSAATTVRATLGAKAETQGVFQVGRALTPAHTFADGTSGVKVRGDQAVSFFVHPSFANLQTREFHVRLTLRRIGAGNVGMNFNYERADSQGRGPYKNTGQWFSLGSELGWQTQTWHVRDASFSKLWGYDFSFRPEQSVPFVIGKVEVSTQPF